MIVREISVILDCRQKKLIRMKWVWTITGKIFIEELLYLEGKDRILLIGYGEILGGKRIMLEKLIQTELKQLSR